MKVIVISEGATNEYKIMEVVVYAKKKRFHFLVESEDGNSMAYMAMIRRMRNEQLTARYIQHNNNKICSKVFNFQH